MKQLKDSIDGRLGEWMHTSTGGKFFPLDPRASEVCISDIANGLALDCRYAGQGRVDRFYSVAEHSVHVARVFRKTYYDPYLSDTSVARGTLAALLHDAPEAYINDLPRAAKLAVGEGYRCVEDKIDRVILRKYGVLLASREYRREIKELDRRIIVNEKNAIVTYPEQPWANDILTELPITIYCWNAPTAKNQFLLEYLRCCEEARIEPEPVTWAVQPGELMPIA